MSILFEDPEVANIPRQSMDKKQRHWAESRNCRVEAVVLLYGFISTVSFKSCFKGFYEGYSRGLVWCFKSCFKGFYEGYSKGVSLVMRVLAV